MWNCEKYIRKYLSEAKLRLRAACLSVYTRLSVTFDKIQLLLVKKQVVKLAPTIQLFYHTENL